jgi:tetratricopeptide (TPR) repeat protein
MLASSERVRLVVAFTAAAVLYGVSWLVGEDLRGARAALPPIEDRLFVPNPRTARFISAGYNELAADVVWARTLVYYGDGVSKGFAMKDVEPLVALVNTLDPFFHRPYAWGGYATTFRQKETTQDDYRASVEILERGAKAFPQDWELAWMLGLRYYSDLKSSDPVEQKQLQEIGVSYIEKAMRLPKAPGDLPNLAASLRSKLGQHDRALRELKEMIVVMEPGAARDKLIDRYRLMSSESQAQAIRDATDSFHRDWKRDLPFAPATLYSLVGKEPPPRSPRQLLEGPTFLGLADQSEGEDDDGSLDASDGSEGNVPLSPPPPGGAIRQGE